MKGVFLVLTKMKGVFLVPTLNGSSAHERGEWLSCWRYTKQKEGGFVTFFVLTINVSEA